MDKLELAKYLLEEVGMPPKQQSTPDFDKTCTR